MSALRILPLVGVAVGGLIAVKAMTGAAALPDLLSASRAVAEEAPAKSGKPHKLNEAAAQSPLQRPSTPAPPKPPPICAPSLAELAKEASLSPAELNTLQSLQARRGQLDQRERDIDTQRQLLAAAELKLDAKLRAITALRDEMKGVLSQADKQKDAEVDRLVKVYEKMKPRDAGAVMATLDERVRLPVASRMKEAALAAILSQMGTLEAKKLTEGLARRFAPPDKLVQAAASPPPKRPAVAQDPLAQDASDDPDEVVKPKPPAARPKSPAKAPVKRAAAKPARPARPSAQAKADVPATADAPSAPEQKVAAAPPPTASPAQVAQSGDTARTR